MAGILDGILRDGLYGAEADAKVGGLADEVNGTVEGVGDAHAGRADEVRHQLALHQRDEVRERLHTTEYASIFNDTVVT